MDVLYVLLRWGYFTALMLATGCAFYIVWLAPDGFRAHLAARLRPLLLGAVCLAPACACALLAALPGTMSGDWRGVIDADIWRAVLTTGIGKGWSRLAALSCLACLGLAARERGRSLTILAACALQWYGLAFVGHAAAPEGWAGALQRANHSLHLISAALWAGGLPPLLILMADVRRPAHRADTIRTMMRFSRYGHLWVALTLVTGSLNAFLILGWPPPGIGLYSGLLLVKALLVLLMVAIALVNRYWLVPRFDRGDGMAPRLLLRLTWLEVAIAALVLLSVSFFATQSPG